MFNRFDERNLLPNGIYAIVDVISTVREHQLQGQEVIYCITHYLGQHDEIMFFRVLNMLADLGGKHSFIFMTPR